MKRSHPDTFVNRHIGPTIEEATQIQRQLGINDWEELIRETIPSDIRISPEEMEDLPEAKSEYEFLQWIRELAEKNELFDSYIGMGYYDVITPSVIKRNIFENPGWYTQYTPYQAEISQGRLEALLNFQTMSAT